MKNCCWPMPRSTKAASYISMLLTPTPSGSSLHLAAQYGQYIRHLMAWEGGAESWTSLMLERNLSPSILSSSRPPSTPTCSPGNSWALVSRWSHSIALSECHKMRGGFHGIPLDKWQTNINTHGSTEQGIEMSGKAGCLCQEPCALVPRSKLLACFAGFETQSVSDQAILGPRDIWGELLSAKLCGFK